MSKADPLDELLGHLDTVQKALEWAQARIIALEAGLRPFAERLTVAEALTGVETSEWMNASVKRRVELMGERRRKHDEAVLKARALLNEEPGA